jgi:hypothetical protein
MREECLWREIMEIIRNNFLALINPSPLAGEAWRDRWIGCPLFVVLFTTINVIKVILQPLSQDCFVIEEESTLELYLRGTGNMAK